MANLRKDGEQWALILARELCYATENVRHALNDAPHRLNGSCDADGSLGMLGKAKLAFKLTKASP